MREITVRSRHYVSTIKGVMHQMLPGQTRADIEGAAKVERRFICWLETPGFYTKGPLPAAKPTKPSKRVRQ